ncbi:MAG: fatty acid desaturase [Sphingobacteriales bacterium]|nr:MAG: fatty acid desaturase [Sphingobacteriales bacterium]
MLTDAQKTTLIRKEIAQSYKDFKQKYPILKNQNTIGLIIFLFSVIMIVLASILYLKNILSIWILIPFNAFWMGILHELEHDLIHWMYFRKNKLVHDSMLFVIWILRPLTINPWLRRDLHFHHHKYSGTLHDVEERGVTNGEKWSLKRLITTPDLLLGGILRANTIRKDIIKQIQLGNLSKAQALRFKTIKTYAMLPFGLMAHFLWYVFLIHVLIHFFTNTFGIAYTSPAIVTNNMWWLQPFIMILILPNLLRQFCLHFITSNMHYFGDVESGNVIQQTQILNIWWTFPLQLFCFFFGWTHAIHHFVVNETFYIRHLTRKNAHKIMKENGVRFNDLGTFKRANRYNDTQKLTIA